MGKDKNLLTTATDKLTAVFNVTFPGCTLEMDGLGGTVIWDGFENVPIPDRIAHVYDVVKATLGFDERVGVFCAFSASEWAHMEEYNQY